ncbi:MAG: hypothetical protein VYC62_09125 [Verrucomicrobiota bacterium]|nr:hypothetical protein [Verrucomicrobiota bacterium]
MVLKLDILNRALLSMCFFGVSILAVSAIQDDQSRDNNDYLAINTRNAFGLANEPPSRKESSPPPEPTKDLDLKFTGIFRLKGVEKACLAVIDTSAKPPETNYFQIPVGDKQGAIEIKSIDAKAGLVKLLRNGKLLELNLSNDEHTYKTAVAKAPSKSKSSSRSSSSKTSSSRSSSSRSSSSSTRPSRTSSSSRGTGSSSRSVPGRSSNSMRSVPMRGGSTNPNPPVVQQDRDPAVQAIEMVQQKQEAESVGVPMPPLPFQKDIEGQGPVPPPVPGQGPFPPPVPGQGPPIPPGR